MLDNVANNVGPAVSQPRRRRQDYRSPIGRRAAAAVIMIRDWGWGAKEASALFCVNRSYLNLVRKLTDADRRRLVRGELTLAALWREHCRELAERRAQRIAAEREAKVKAEREAQTLAVDDVLETVGLDRIVDRIVSRNGPEDLLEELEVALKRRGENLGEIVAGVSNRRNEPCTS
jgi:hypothetical protein